MSRESALRYLRRGRTLRALATAATIVLVVALMTVALTGCGAEEGEEPLGDEETPGAGGLPAVTDTPIAEMTPTVMEEETPVAEETPEAETPAAEETPEAETPMAEESPTAGEVTAPAISEVQPLLQTGGCGDCHEIPGIEGATGTTAPSFCMTAQDVQSGERDLEYVHESIVDPDAEVHEGYQAGIMPDNYEETYSEEEIDTLVSFIATLDCP